MQGWKSLLEAGTKLAGAGGASQPCQVGSDLRLPDKVLSTILPSLCSWKQVLYDFHKGCRYKWREEKCSRQVDGLDHTNRLSHSYEIQAKDKKNHLFSHPAEPLNGFQQWVGHKAVFSEMEMLKLFPSLNIQSRQQCWKNFIHKEIEINIAMHGIGEALIWLKALNFQDGVCAAGRVLPSRDSSAGKTDLWSWAPLSIASYQNKLSDFQACQEAAGPRSTPVMENNYTADQS